MLPQIGFPSLILIIVVALLIFGPNRLPEFGRAAGETITQFKKSTKNIMDDKDQKTDPENKTS